MSYTQEQRTEAKKEGGNTDTQHSSAACRPGKKNGAPKGGERDTTPFSIYSRPLQMAVISRTTRQPPAVKKRHQIRRSTSDVAARPRPFPIFFFLKIEKKKNQRPSINYTI